MTKKSILNRSFTTREKGLILALAVLLIIAFYYFMVVQNVVSVQAANEQRISELQLQVDEQMAIATQRTQMESELASLGSGESLPEIVAYDNFDGEWSDLRSILKGATSFQLNFGDPVASGEIVRRPVEVTFTASSYEKALSLVKQIQSGSYRCMVNDFGLSKVSASVSDKEGVSATLSLTYFETTRGATDLTGLTYDESAAESASTEE